jgi:hypothetical protein
MADVNALHSCCGLNECAGLGKNGSGTMPGNGSCATANVHGCSGGNDCKGQGGCGYAAGSDTGPIAAANDCKGLGGCASPIGSGDAKPGEPLPVCSWTYQSGTIYTGQNVWQKGREALEQRMTAKGKQVGPSPCCGG